MSFDKRFYGIYSAIIADGQDPEGLGRVKLIIPQVLGDNITEWALPVNGSVPEINYPYGTFIKAGNQAVTGTNTATVVTGWVEEDANRSNSSNTQIFVEESGDYLFQFSTVFTKSGGSLTTADMWLRKNGTNIANTNTRVTISGNNEETVITVPFILDLDAGDYLEIVFSSPESTTKITGYSASSTPTRPAMPAIIVTLSLVGKWKPQPGTKAWAMFEGGDPNFPVWMGALA